MQKLLDRAALGWVQRQEDTIVVTRYDALILAHDALKGWRVVIDIWPTWSTGDTTRWRLGPVWLRNAVPSSLCAAHPEDVPLLLAVLAVDGRPLANALQRAYLEYRLELAI